MPTVGAGSSQREDFPAHRLPAHTIQGLGNAHLYAMAWLGRVLAGGRATFGPPLQPLPYQDPHEARRCPHKRCDAARHVATNAPTTPATMPYPASHPSPSPPPPHHRPPFALPSPYLL